MILFLVFSNSFSYNQANFQISKSIFSDEILSNDKKNLYASDSFDSSYNKTFTNIGRIGFHGEYLRTVPRILPQLKSENMISINLIPTYNSNISLSYSEKEDILLENILISAKSSITDGGVYEILDKDGNLYLNNSIIEWDTKKIYKHYGSIGNYEGNLLDSEPAYVKRMTFYPRGFCYSITGLYAPPGEVVSIRIREKDLQSVEKLYVAIGPIFRNDYINYMTLYQEFNRMPLQTNLFELTTELKPCDREGSDYIFHVGSFLGGPIYIRPAKLPLFYSVTIKGAVRYLHYIHGYTSESEFNELLHSTAPYFDLEIWNKGIVHSGPRSRVPISTFQDAYEIATFWEKVTSVSGRFVSELSDKCPINFFYDCFTDGPIKSDGDHVMDLEYLTKVLSKNRNDEIWDPLFNFNSHFSVNWGLENCEKETIMALNLIDYCYLTNISQMREPQMKFDFLNDNEFAYAYSSAFFAVSDCVSKNHVSHVSLYATLLHCFGPKMFIESAEKLYGQNNDCWHQSFTGTTHFDMSYFFNTIYKDKPISSDELNRIKALNYKAFIPVACLFQTGIGYIVKGRREEVHTMQPYLIKYNEIFVMDLNENIVLPSGFSFTIKEITSPKHGYLVSRSDNVYVYYPDPDYPLSGQINLTLKITKDDGSINSIDDVIIFIEFQQSHNIRSKINGSYVLDKDIYVYDNYKMVNDPVYAFERNYNTCDYYEITYNENEKQDSNCEIWMSNCIPYRISEIRGKFFIGPGKYRFELRGYRKCALFLSFGNSTNYKLAVNLNNYKYNLSYYLDGIVNFNDYTINREQWVYFKAVLIHNCGYGENPFLGFRIGQFNDDYSLSYDIFKNAYFYDFEFDPPFESDVVLFPSVSIQERCTRFMKKETLLSHNYSRIYDYYHDDDYYIYNLFDDNETNSIYTDSSFYVFVDLGQIFVANRMIISSDLDEWYQLYLPREFILEVGTDRWNLHQIANKFNAYMDDESIIVDFDLTPIRYYKLSIINSYDRADNKIAFRMIKLMKYISGYLVSIDDDRVSLFNSWSKESKQSTFGQLYVAKGSQEKHSKAVFIFTGRKFAINAFKSNEFDGFDVYVDSEKVETISLKGDDNIVRCVYINDSLSDEMHNITIDGKSRFNIDSFIIGQNYILAKEKIYDDEPPQIFNDGDWGSDENKGKNKLSKGQIIFICIGVALFVFIVIIVIFVHRSKIYLCCYNMNFRKKDESSDEDDDLELVRTPFKRKEDDFRSPQRLKNKRAETKINRHEEKRKSPVKIPEYGDSDTASTYSSINETEPIIFNPNHDDVHLPRTLDELKACPPIILTGF